MANQEEVNYMQQIEAELTEARNQNQQLSQGQMSMFPQEEPDNLIRWQLDLKEDLDRLYHLLKGDSLGENANGDIGWVNASDADLRPFNEFGVQMIMNIMSFYLNRNTILSNYDEKTINWKILDFGDEVTNLIFNRYEDMMITITQNPGEDKVAFEDRTKEHVKKKIKYYPMVVKELVDTVHSAYLRAYRGGERESLRTARTVTQSEPIGTRNFGQQPTAFAQPHRKFKLLNPGTWAG